MESSLEQNQPQEPLSQAALRKFVSQMMEYIGQGALTEETRRFYAPVSKAIVTLHREGPRFNIDTSLAAPSSAGALFRRRLVVQPSGVNSWHAGVSARTLGYGDESEFTPFDFSPDSCSANDLQSVHTLLYNAQEIPNFDEQTRLLSHLKLLLQEQPAQVASPPGQHYQREVREFHTALADSCECHMAHSILRIAGDARHLGYSAQVTLTHWRLSPTGGLQRFGLATRYTFLQLDHIPIDLQVVNVQDFTKRFVRRHGGWHRARTEGSESESALRPLQPCSREEYLKLLDILPLSLKREEQA